MNLHQRFAPLMAAALHYAGSPEGLGMPLADIQERLLLLADEERVLPVLPADDDLPHVPEERRRDMDDARFAVYAWADEKLLNAPRPDAGAWMPLSLQCRYFSTTEAGQAFFVRLDTLLDRLGIAGVEDGETLDLAQRLELGRSLPPGDAGCDVLRVFALCLLYGFRGRLYGREELLARVRKACRTLLQRQETAPGPGTSPRRRRRTVLRQLEPAVCALAPAVVCAMFWLFCANILAHIPVTGF